MEEKVDFLRADGVVVVCFCSQKSAASSQHPAINLAADRIHPFTGIEYHRDLSDLESFNQSLQPAAKLWSAGAFFLPPQGVYYPVKLSRLVVLVEYSSEPVDTLLMVAA